MAALERINRDEPVFISVPDGWPSDDCSACRKCLYDRYEELEYKEPEGSQEYLPVTKLWDKHLAKYPYALSVLQSLRKEYPWEGNHRLSLNDPVNHCNQVHAESLHHADKSKCVRCLTVDPEPEVYSDVNRLMNMIWKLDEAWADQQTPKHHIRSAASTWRKLAHVRKEMKGQLEWDVQKAYLHRVVLNPIGHQPDSSTPSKAEIKTSSIANFTAIRHWPADKASIWSMRRGVRLTTLAMLYIKFPQQPTQEELDFFWHKLFPLLIKFERALQDRRMFTRQRLQAMEAFRVERSERRAHLKELQKLKGLNINMPIDITKSMHEDTVESLASNARIQKIYDKYGISMDEVVKIARSSVNDLAYLIKLRDGDQRLPTSKDEDVPEDDHEGEEDQSSEDKDQDAAQWQGGNELVPVTKGRINTKKIIDYLLRLPPTPDELDSCSTCRESFLSNI